MIFHYAGRYNGDEETLPRREHPENATQFREPGTVKQLAAVANKGAILLFVLLAIPVVVLERRQGGSFRFGQYYLGILCAALSLLPHELLHGLFFREDAYLFSNPRQGLLFLVGPEDMSRGRFAAMRLLPSGVFGLVPYVLYLLFPHCLWLGVWGVLALGSGFGDYRDAVNALSQMPRGARTYMSGMHSYWYMPCEENEFTEEV